MNRIPQGNTIVSVQMDRILKSAVVLSWRDLLHPSQSGLIHIEYAPGTRLPYLKIWHLTGRGEWRLVCEYWMPRGTTNSPGDGMTFSNDYHSAGLAEMLEVIMQHQSNFAPGLTFGAGTTQVTTPTAHENWAAEECVKHVYASLGLTFAHIPAAAAA